MAQTLLQLLPLRAIPSPHPGQAATFQDMAIPIPKTEAAQ